MNTHIPFLESVLVLIAVIFPTGLGSNIGVAFSRKKYTIRWDNAGLIIAYIVTIAVVAWAIPSARVGVRLSWWLLLGLAGFLCFFIEFGVGTLAFVGMNHRLPRNIRLSSPYDQYPQVTWVDVTVVCLFVVLEEVVLRSLLYTVLTTMGLTNVVWLAVVMVAIYAVNHVPFGLIAVAQKVFSGTVFVVLFLVSGENLLVPIIAHMIFNCFLLVLSRRQVEEVVLS
ncbi:MAG: CPBP family intramembrane metalloprotease [Propionibacteriaceae bacterium]|nr:CPBP family intramembrane metalloprotease [Propionibacteriaceae bacterium]